MKTVKELKIKSTRLPRSAIIAVGFALLVLLGALVLMLPFATKDGESTSFIGALFTSTSATCVTGLVTYDTATHWTLFGQLVIITLIQIGGLGFITFGVYGIMLFRKRVGLENRELIHDSLNSLNLGVGLDLVKSVVKGTAIVELTGAALLSIRFIPEYGVLRGIYYSLFHSVSAFCNAGFDLFGVKEKFTSLLPYYDDPLVMLTLSALIIIGSIGFAVWGDIHRHGFNFKKYHLHTKVVLLATFVLLFGGTLFFLFSERSGVLSDMSAGNKLLSAFFCAVTPRTAGFNSVDIASLSTAGKVMTAFLMFIGGSPGSTAGGVKTTTVLVIFLFILSYARRQRECRIFKRSLSNELVKKASTVTFVNMSLILVAITVITLSQTLALDDVLLETVSAMSTVGMSTGITRELTVISKIMIMILMYCGRVGSLSFALSFSEKRKIANVRYPEEDILIG